VRLAICLVVLAALFGHSTAAAEVASSAPQADPKEWTARVQRHLLDRVNRSKPAMVAALKTAQAAGLSGDVVVMVGFVVDRSGRIQSTQITRSSGNSDIDAIAQRMVARAGPVPAIPAAVPGDTKTFQLPINFKPPGSPRPRT
jgi:TonB family protein